MSTETTERAVPRAVPAAMPVGGAVVPIVPQSFEEIQRVSNTVIMGGLAPASLIKWPKDNDDEATIRDIGRRNVAAVAGVLMAGAELGVPPMAALRMFTSINGRPALYADGNVAVVRRARDRDGNLICEYIRQGFVRGTDDESTFAWCEAKRADNGEVHREEFTISDAKLAGLWDDNPHKRAKVWRNGKQDWYDDVPNDSAWHRYPKRMMLWRATGYCLRWLFADVLAGMVDEFEAREIEGMVDITPSLPPSRPQPPTPPAPPADDNATEEPEDATTDAETATNGAPDAPQEAMTLAEAAIARQAELHNSDQPEGGENEVSGAESETENSATGTAEEAPSPPPAPEEPPEPGSDEWFERLEIYLKETKSADDIEALWVEMDVESELSSTSIATMDRADELKKHHLARVGGQGDLLGGGNA